MTSLTIQPIKTSIYRTGDLADFIIQSIPAQSVQDNMIVAVTSKIVSLSEGRLVPRIEINKKELVMREADVFIGEIGYGCFLTIKDGLLIPSAGIDESNSESGDYILYPLDPFASAQRIWNRLREAWNLSRLGVVLTDSHTTPLRRGVTGVALSYWGFQPLRKLVGTQDLFGRELQMTNMNLVDGIAAGAVLMMGEGCESTPLALIRGLQVEFSEQACLNDLSIPLSEDLYGPLVRSAVLRNDG